MTRTARARAYLQGRDYVLPDDVKAMAPKVMRHRLRTTYEADARSIKSDELIARVLEGRTHTLMSTDPHHVFSPEVTAQLKRIELTTASLVESLFSGEYHSIFKGTRPGVLRTCGSISRVTMSVRSTGT